MHDRHEGPKRSIAVRFHAILLVLHLHVHTAIIQQLAEAARSLVTIVLVATCSCVRILHRTPTYSALRNSAARAVERRKTLHQRCVFTMADIGRRHRA